MKIIAFIFCLFFCLILEAQTSTIKNETNSLTVGLSNEEFSYACSEYKKVIETDTYIESEKKTRAFSEKIDEFIISNNIPFDSIKDKGTALKLIKNNLKKTKFKSVPEAEKYIDEMESITEKLERENKLLYELIEKATVEQRHKIFQPLFNRARNEINGY